MKYLLLVVPVVIVVLSIFMYARTSNGPQNYDFQEEVTTFYCPNGSTLTIQYDDDASHARLSLSGTQYILTREKSDSEIRYFGEDSGTTFSEQQGEALVMVGGQSNLLSCRSEELVKYEPQSFVGSWVEPVPGNPAQRQGFTLNQDGTAKSINMSTLLYKKWEIDGQDVVFEVESIGNGVSSTESVRYQIIRVEKDELVFQNRGTRMTFSRMTEPVIEDLIRVSEPTAGVEIDNPVEVSGEAKGYWFFEATAPVSIVNWDGLIIGEGYISADGEWMTEDFVPFTGTIEYELPEDSYSASGTIIFMKSNPSDLPENDAAFEIPVMLEEESE